MWLTGRLAPDFKACTEAGITPLVPKPMTSNARTEGRFSKLDFVCVAKDDEYQCPAGERAIHRFRAVESGLVIHKYWSSSCPRCSLKSQCTTSSYRRMTRWEHEDILEAMQRRLDRKPGAMTLRRRTIEHVFGTLKHWMGATHFLMRGLAHVNTEMSLYVPAYNLKRVIRCWECRKRCGQRDCWAAEGTLLHKSGRDHRVRPILMAKVRRKGASPARHRSSAADTKFVSTRPRPIAVVRSRYRNGCEAG